MQDFLHPKYAQNIHLSKFLFNAHPRMLDFRINFRKKYSDVKCPLGCDELDPQQHGLICDKIFTNVLVNLLLEYLNPIWLTMYRW